MCKLGARRGQPYCSDHEKAIGRQAATDRQEKLTSWRRKRAAETRKILAQRNEELSARVRWEIEQSELEQAEAKEMALAAQRDNQLRTEFGAVNKIAPHPPRGSAPENGWFATASKLNTLYVPPARDSRASATWSIHKRTFIGQAEAKSCRMLVTQTFNWFQRRQSTDSFGRVGRPA